MSFVLYINASRDLLHSYRSLLADLLYSCRSLLALSEVEAAEETSCRSLLALCRIRKRDLM
jgi:hypothetical protein